MFDMIRAAPICVWVDRKVQDSIGECLTLPDNPCRTSGRIEVLDKISAPILEGEIGAKNPVVWARLYPTFKRVIEPIHQIVNVVLYYKHPSLAHFQNQIALFIQYVQQMKGSLLLPNFYFSSTQWLFCRLHQ